MLEHCSKPLADFYSGMTDDKQFIFFQFDTMVSFPFRQTGLVRIVLRRSSQEPLNEQKLNFWTVYEPRRKHDGLGVQELRHP